MSHSGIPFPIDCDYPTEKACNHGKQWLNDHEDRLIKAFKMGASLQAMCEALRRTPQSLLARLVNLQLVQREASTHNRYSFDYYYTKAPHATQTPTPTTQPTEETTMTANIETKTLVSGNDFALMSDTQIFSQIAQWEERIDKLNRIKNKPKKLVTVIEGLQADIDKLVKLVDERPEM